METEIKFRLWAKKNYPFAFIKKMPDFKQLATSALIGMPDYLIIKDGNHFWYEVKKVYSKYISLKAFTPGQLIVFSKMLKAGVDIYVYVFYPNGVRIILFQDIMIYKRIKLSE